VPPESGNGPASSSRPGGDRRIPSGAERAAVSRLLTVTGRNVLFAHWPLAPGALAPAVPDPLELETFEGTAWVSVVALENAVAPGTARPPTGLGGEMRVPQLNLRTYVTGGGVSGVYFLSLFSGCRALAATARRAFGLPFRGARMRTTRRGDEITVRSHGHRDGGIDAVFGARYRPDGAPYRPTPGTLEAFCVDRVRYHLPVAEDRRVTRVPSPFRRLGADGDGASVGRIERDPWTLRPAAVTIRRNSLFEAAGLPTPEADPVGQYSPSFEMGVEPIDGPPADADGDRADASP